MATRMARGAPATWLGALLASALAVPALAASDTTAERLLERGGRARELAHPPQGLRGDPLLDARRDQQGQRQGPQGRLDLRARRHRGRRHLAARRPRGHPDRRGRLHVRHRRLGLGLQARHHPGPGQAGVEDGSGHRQGLVGRGLVLRRQQPRRRAVAGQGDLAHPGRPAARDRQGDRRGRLGAAGGRSGDRRGHHRGAAGGQGPGDHRRLGRGVRHPRLDRRDRPEHRQGGVAPAHHPRPRRARPRHLGGRARRLEDRRRLDLGHRLLRSARPI